MSDALIAKQKRRFDRQVAAARYWLLSQADNNPRYFSAVEALEFGMAHHNGKRNGGGPEFMHQIEIFHMLRTLRHYLPDPVLSFTLAFLHDAVEDPQKQPDGSKVYVTMDTITSKWGAQVALKLHKLSKEIEGEKNPNYSLDAIFDDEDCALVKLADRCNNVSTMMGVFKRERALRYIKETVEEFIPRAKVARRRFPQQEGAFENMKLILNGQMSLIELMMPTYQIDLPMSTLSTDWAPASPDGVYKSPLAKVSTLATDKPVPDEKAIAPTKASIVDVIPEVPVFTAADLPKTADKKVLSTRVGMIMATGPGGVLGNNQGHLAFRVKQDLARFAEITANCPLVMGRKTFESIANIGNTMYRKTAPLAGRFIYVLTRNKEIAGEMMGRSSSAPGYVYVHVERGETVDEVVRRINIHRLGTSFQDKMLWVCGGAEIYDFFVHCKDLKFIDHTTIDLADDNEGAAFDELWSRPESGMKRLPWANSAFSTLQHLRITTNHSKWKTNIQLGQTEVSGKVLTIDGKYLDRALVMSSTAIYKP